MFFGFEVCCFSDLGLVSIFAKKSNIAPIPTRVEIITVPSAYALSKSNILSRAGYVIEKVTAPSA